MSPQRARCKHFTGIQHDACALGIAYDTVRDDSERPYRWPCTNSALTTCSRREFPTQAEELAEVAEMEATFGRVARARISIIAKHGRQRGIRDEMACPVCTTGTLRYSIAKLNGHIHAACTTDGCVRWME